MKAKLLIIALLSFALHQANAQFVDIPDSNFKKVLIAKYPSCFNANKQMDTTCSGIVSEVKLDVSLKGISNLFGIQFFDKLGTLLCTNNKLSSLPTLPGSLNYLYCSDNKLTSLPILPSGLINLSCFNNPLTSLPTLPNGLTDLRCTDNKLSSLPTLPSGLINLSCFNNPLSSLPTLPGSLYYLYCSNNQLTNLPALPSSLIELNCSENGLTSLPSLPSSLKKLDCYNNLLKSLPALPSSLIVLDCSYNQLRNLPFLPSGLTRFNCRSNQLTSLPALPSSLSELDCSYNQLRNLPFLPSSLTYLYCDNNQLKCLPFLPLKLSTLSFDKNLIKCFPNKPSDIASTIASTPICNTTNNPSQCQNYPHITGKVFLDANKDGMYSQSETLVPDISIRTSDKNKTKVLTNYNGEYTSVIDTLGSFTFTPDAIKNYTIVPTSKIATFTYYGEEVIQDFALQAHTNAEDLYTKLSANNLARPGFSLSIELTNNNVGTIDGTAFQSFHFPSEYIIDSISNGGSESSTGTIIWASASMSPFAQNKLRVYGHVSSGSALGTKLTFYSRISPNSTTDVDMTNNIDSTTLVVRGSYDPNDKAATPILSPSQVANGTAIDYTVRFQNTGTDTAFTVVVMDSLTSNLQANTLELVSSSHSCKTTVKGNVVSFEFLKINLLAMSKNEVASHGYVRFKVKPKSTLVLGDKVNNRAAIYFDYNKPVITNTAVTEIKIPDVVTGFESNNFADKLALHPNPATAEVMLSENGKVEVYTVEGVLVLSINVQNNTMDISSLTKGIYFLKLTTANGQRKSVKMVKE